MSVPTEELRSIHEFVVGLLARPDPGALSLDEALALWDLEHQNTRDEAETVEAIRRGLDDLDAGRTSLIEEFDREFRERHGLASRP